MDEWVYCGKEYCTGVAKGDIIILRNEDVSQSQGARTGVAKGDIIMLRNEDVSQSIRFRTCGAKKAHQIAMGNNLWLTFLNACSLLQFFYFI